MIETFAFPTSEENWRSFARFPRNISIHLGKTRTRNIVVAVQEVARCFAQPAGFTQLPFAKGGIGETFRDNTKTGGSPQASAGSKQNGTV